MKRKTFEFEDHVAATFEEFCRRRLLVQAGVVQAALVHWMGMSSEERDAVLERFTAEHYGQMKGGELRVAERPSLSGPPRRKGKPDDAGDQ